VKQQTKPGAFHRGCLGTAEESVSQQLREALQTTTTISAKAVEHEATIKELEQKVFTHERLHADVNRSVRQLQASSEDLQAALEQLRGLYGQDSNGLPQRLPDLLQTKHSPSDMRLSSSIREAFAECRESMTKQRPFRETLGDQFPHHHRVDGMSSKTPEKSAISMRDRNPDSPPTPSELQPLQQSSVNRMDESLTESDASPLTTQAPEMNVQDAAPQQPKLPLVLGDD